MSVSSFSKNLEDKSGTRRILPDQNLEAIKQWLPHRYPMLMIDKVTQLRSYDCATGIKCVTNNEPFFQGHFPHKPVMPGMLIVEAMAQTAAVLIAASLEIYAKDRLIYFLSVDGARFRKPVEPGSVLELRVKTEQNRGNIWRFHGSAHVEDAVCAEARFMAMLHD